jgi:hypothetical protein
MAQPRIQNDGPTASLPPHQCIGVRVYLQVRLGVFEFRAIVIDIEKNNTVFSVNSVANIYFKRTEQC